MCTKPRESSCHVNNARACFICFSKDTGILTTGTYLCPTAPVLEMQGLDEHTSNEESPDQQSTDAEISNYTSLDHRTMQENHFYDVIST